MCRWSFTGSVGRLAPGSHTVSAVAVDPSNNIAATAGAIFRNPQSWNGGWLGRFVLHSDQPPRMGRPANPYDNASCESFIKTLKREEIYANEYGNLEHLRDHIEEFIERYYNQKRLHSALGYCSPEEFEQQARQESEVATIGATVRFFQGTQEEVSTKVLGEGTQVPSLPQPPSLLGESTR